MKLRNNHNRESGIASQRPAFSNDIAWTLCRTGGVCMAEAESLSGLQRTYNLIKQQLDTYKTKQSDTESTFVTCKNIINIAIPLEQSLNPKDAIDYKDQ